MAALTVPYPEPWRMSEAEYLQTVFEPDADFVDGVIEERPMGEFDHSTWQEALQAWFRVHAPEWQLRARPALRCKVSPTRYRIPDVAVTSMTNPVEQVPVTPPVAVFEILSPEDRLKRTVIKLGDYERMGIRNIFLIEPEGPLIFHFKDGTLGPAEAVVPLEGTAGSVDWAAIQALDLLETSAPFAFQRAVQGAYVKVQRDRGGAEELVEHALHALKVVEMTQRRTR